MAKKNTPQDSPPPPGGFPDLCGNCRRPLEPDGRCADCGGWPYCVWLVERSTGVPLRFPHGAPAWDVPTPPRACPACGGKVGTNGMCGSCPGQVAPALLHQDESGHRGVWTVSDEAGPWTRPPVSPEAGRERIRAVIALVTRAAVAPVERVVHERIAPVELDEVPF